VWGRSPVLGNPAFGLSRKFGTQDG
jgi:hypothetical protein